jgi:hypothetical protein
MKTMWLRGMSALLAGGLMVALPSCKEDEPPVPPKLSFELEELTVNEADGEIEVKLVLDKPAATDIEIEYSIGGTANEETKIGNNGNPDYAITSKYLEAEIKAGESEAIITLELFSDTEVEDDEIIELQIEGVDDDAIEITRDDEIVITVKQEDGMIVVLAWGISPDRYTDVDMDLFLWAEDNAGALQLTSFGALTPSTTSPEFFFLPAAPLRDGTYGLSCTYYEGTASPMNFRLSYIKWVNGAQGTTVNKNGSYTLANINKWDDQTTGKDPVLVFTFEKAGNDFRDFSDFIPPANGGSRIRSVKIPETLKRK